MISAPRVPTPPFLVRAIRPAGFSGECVPGYGQPPICCQVPQPGAVRVTVGVSGIGFEVRFEVRHE
eukprot:1179914-Rhodomonas_salina.1